jgi:hypothetical protein
MGEDKKRGGRGEVKVLRIASRCSQHKLKITNTMYFYSFIHKSHARFAVFFPISSQCKHFTCIFRSCPTVRECTRMSRAIT